MQHYKLTGDGQTAAALLAACWAAGCAEALPATDARDPAMGFNRLFIHILPWCDLESARHAFKTHCSRQAHAAEQVRSPTRTAHWQSSSRFLRFLSALQPSWRLDQAARLLHAVGLSDFELLARSYLRHMLDVH